eukprot:5500643-Pyramimonas_sp.AAC.1
MVLPRTTCASAVLIAMGRFIIAYGAALYLSGRERQLSMQTSFGRHARLIAPTSSSRGRCH